MSTEVTVSKIPPCDLCQTGPATVDGKTLRGPWAYMCDECWIRYGVSRLGTGYGQRLIPRHEDDKEPGRMPNHPTRFAAVDLAAALAQYGQMAIVVMLVDADGNEMIPRATEMRLEMTEHDGRRVVAITGYVKNFD